MSIDLTYSQSDLFEDIFLKNLARFYPVCCSRGWGKSFLGATAVVTACHELLQLERDIPDKRVWLIAPTYEQAIDIYYPILYYELGLEDACTKISKDDGVFQFPNRVDLRLLSYESIERMRGKGAYFVAWDEVSSCKKGMKPKDAWNQIIKPCIVTRWSPQRARLFRAKNPGRALFISTPKGYNFFYDLFNMPEVDNEWRSYKYDYTTSPLLDPEEIEKQKHSMDPIEFASEYLASFEESGNNVFYCFDRKLHVSKTPLLPFQTGEDVHVAIDFNVGLQCSSAFALRGGQMQFLEEFKGHPDTTTLASVLRKKYEGHKIYAYPDPTGKARRSSAAIGVTDLSILKDAGIIVRAKEKSPPIVDSVQAVNRKLKTATGVVGMLFDPRLKGTIQSMERTRWQDNNPDLAMIDKSEGLEHYSDGVRYATDYLFPVVHSRVVSKKGNSF